MTRPMPGPPECECREVPAHLWTTYAGAVDPNTRFEYTPECPLHGEVSSPKRLTDAECYDEWGAFEQVESYGLLCIEMGDKRMAFSRFEREANESETWHRFATHPHALGANGAAS